MKETKSHVTWFHVGEISVIGNHYAEEAEVEWFCEDLQDPLELTPKQILKRCPFHHRGQNAKVGSQEIPGVNRQVWP